MKIKVSAHQQGILDHLKVPQLVFFSKIAEDKDFKEFTKLANTLIDLEKNSFFGEREYDEKKLAVNHAYSRGGIGMLVNLLKIIAASTHELEVRKQKD